MNKNSKFQLLLPLIFALVLASGIFIGKTISSSQTGIHNILPVSNKLNMLINTISTEYVDSVDKNAMIEKAIKSVVADLDPHTSYLSAQNIAKLNENLKGNFYGIGVQFNVLKDTILILHTVKNGPSDKAGILAGDKIVTVNDSLFAGNGLTNEKIMKYLKGERGTSVKVGIKRHGKSEILNFNIIRDKIPINSIDVAYMINEEIGYIKVNRFSETTHNDLSAALKKLKRQGMNKLILDLRYNGGGYLTAAVKIADEFLPEKKLIVYTQGRASKRKDYRSTPNGLFEQGELVILINSWSASASEVVSGAIQDNDRGSIIGRRSFGKGLVQITNMFKDGSALELTTARYYSPSGRCIQKPYNKDIKKYNSEISERYVKGEFSYADSISFDKSQKFKTTGGRTVYGGGGIMPDIFVPIDTVMISKFMDNIIGKMHKYSLMYVDNNRDELSKFTNRFQLAEYLDNKNVMSNYLHSLNRKGEQINLKRINKHKKIIKTYLYSFICRNILNEEEYFAMMEDTDKILKEAIAYLSKNS